MKKPGKTSDRKECIPVQSQGCSAKMSEIPQHFLKYQLLLGAAPDRRKTVPTFAGGFSLCPCVGLDGMEFHGWDLGAENAPRGVSHWLEPQAGFFGFCTEKFPFGSGPKHGMRRFRKFWEFFGIFLSCQVPKKHLQCCRTRLGIPRPFSLSQKFHIQALILFYP